MRHVRCEKCMDKKIPGTRLICPRSQMGEPAEFERVILGTARQPEQSQRWISINGVRENLPTEHFNCDGCGAHIKPGENCGAWTVWTEEQQEPPAWEGEFICAA